MSEHPTTHDCRSARRRDAGMTLPELLISISMLGLVAAVLSSAMIVTLRQQDNTKGRLNVARSEQVVSMFLPADLSSASDVSTDPDATPCGATVCDGIDLSNGSNVLLLGWSSENGDGTVTETKVSYHFSPSAGVDTYELARIECISTGGAAFTCTRRVVLSELPGPPGGDPFIPGVANGAACRQEVNPVPCTRPDWVIIVSQPLPPDALTLQPGQVLSESQRKNANRVIVSINGGGDTAGAGGGINQISITAGGTSRSTIASNSVQGAPSFNEARSRCGGPMTLIVDQSNSIGSAIGDVKTGVRAFIESLAGTPVQLQIIGFETLSQAMGSSDWHRYFDMTKDDDVNALLASVNSLKGSGWSGSRGGTNWEEALFRTFYEPDGSIAAKLPDTVVFFTDGVPTFDRMVHRTTPGVLPADPPPPGAPWATSTGSSYSQVAFRRADFIANKFRRNVNIIGVGVGSGIVGSSPWVVDPGAGYRNVTERGSYSHVMETYTYEARYQKKDSKWGSYYWVNRATYDTATWRQKVDWTSISQAQYDSINVSEGDSDGVRQTPVSIPISTAQFNADPTNPAYSTVSKQWSNGPDWEVWTGSKYDSYTRTTKLYNSPPYTDYDPAVTAMTRSDIILARLISGNDTGDPAVWDSTTNSYLNASAANMYVLPQWSQFKRAMQAVALGECGGTLTLQTKVNGTSAAQDPFRYQNSAVTDSTGAPMPFEPTVVTTNQTFVTGTFDFAVPNGQFVTVDIVPQNYSELKGYTPGAWTCRAGNAPRSFELIDIPDAGAWKGVRVEVAANEAVSCQLAVTR